MMLTKINSLRFDPTLHIMRNDHLDDDTVCELARTSGKVANVHPLFWRSDLAQAAKFHAWSMATSTHPCLQKNTCPHHCALFDGDCAAATRVAYFHEAATNPRGVATIVGEGSPDDVLVCLFCLLVLTALDRMHGYGARTRAPSCFRGDTTRSAWECGRPTTAVCFGPL